MSRYGPTARPPMERILWIDDRLRKGGKLRLQDICEKFEIDERTAYRDIAFLRDRLQAPIAHTRDRGYYYTDPNFRIGSILLTEGELFALLLAKQVLDQYIGRPYEAELRRAFARICEALPEAITLDAEQLEAMISFRAEPARLVDPEMLLQVQEAIRLRRRFKMRYYVASRDEETERVVDPLHLHNYQGDWYLVAFDLGRQALRDFAISRILEVHPTGEPATEHPEFDRDAYIAGHFGGFQGDREIEVVIRFDGYQARWIREKTWPGQIAQAEQEDGSLLLHLRVTSLEGLQRWVLQYGSHAQVLTPPELRQRIRHEAEKMVKLYQG
jgi:predicted DNA-binding transcriptional regulator YafY